MDVRWEPLVVRDGCRPARIPDGRWPSDGALVRSEQFAVNEAVALPGGGVFAVHAPPGTGVAEVYGDLVAAIITERARRIADLPGPAAAFGELRSWSTHRVAAPNRTLTGFEIVLGGAGVERADRARTTSHWGGVAGGGHDHRLLHLHHPQAGRRRRRVGNAGGSSRRRRGQPRVRRAMVARGRTRHRRVVPGGRVDGRRATAAASRERSGGLARRRREVPVGAGEDGKACSERSEVAAAVTRISELEQACEEASCSAEAAQARLADLAAGEPAVREALAEAEEEQQALLADLGAHQLDRPMFTTDAATTRRRYGHAARCRSR